MYAEMPALADTEVGISRSSTPKMYWMRKPTTNVGTEMRSSDTMSDTVSNTPPLRRPATRPTVMPMMASKTSARIASFAVSGKARAMISLTAWPL